MFEDLTVVDLLHRASQCAEMIFEDQIGEIDLTARQYAILRVVSKSNRPSQTDIVGATGIDRSTVAEMTRRLAKKGLVRRRRNQDDARAFAVLLTAAGRQMIQTVALASQRSEDKIYAAVKSLRGAEFRASLGELIAA